ncbi:hypothetical protein NSP_11300 [Nodularia spumigena CCY9414]|nr:hypothetical protein NSP_11300 [Nodularia spumigena CCY9414]
MGSGEKRQGSRVQGAGGRRGRGAGCRVQGGEDGNFPMTND